MKDVRKIFEECCTELRRINMDISDNIKDVKVNGRLSRALGRCCARRDWRRMEDEYTIEINPCMLADDVEMHIVKNTMIHELLHTCPNCMNHGPEWTSRAGRVNRMLGYNVKRLAEVSGLEAAGVKLSRPDWKYAIVCNECGRVVEKRNRWSKTLENIGNYRHGGGCGGHLHVMEIDSDGTMIAANAHR